MTNWLALQSPVAHFPKNLNVHQVRATTVSSASPEKSALPSSRGIYSWQHCHPPPLQGGTFLQSCRILCVTRKKREFAAGRQVFSWLFRSVRTSWNAFIRPLVHSCQNSHVYYKLYFPRIISKSSCQRPDQPNSRNCILVSPVSLFRWRRVPI